MSLYSYINKAEYEKTSGLAKLAQRVLRDQKEVTVVVGE